MKWYKGVIYSQQSLPSTILSSDTTVLEIGALENLISHYLLLLCSDVLIAFCWAILNELVDCWLLLLTLNSSGAHPSNRIQDCRVWKVLMALFMFQTLFVNLLLLELLGRKQRLFEGGLWLRFVSPDDIEFLYNITLSFAPGILYLHALNGVPFNWCVVRLLDLLLWSIINTDMLWLGSWLRFGLTCSPLLLELLHAHRGYKRSSGIRSSMCRHVRVWFHIRHFCRTIVDMSQWSWLSAIHCSSSIEVVCFFSRLLASFHNVFWCTIWWHKFSVAAHVDSITCTINLRTHATWSSSSLPHVHMSW